jgi:hypothetical protein
VSASPPPGLTGRLLARIQHDFGSSAKHVLDQLRKADVGNQDPERVLAAIIVLAKGDPARLRYFIDLSRTDWRDVLVFSGLGNADWSEQLDRILG